MLYLAEADLEGRDRVAIIRQRLKLIEKPQLVGLQCPGDDSRGSPVAPCLAAGLMVSGLAASLGAEVPVQDVVLRGKVVTLAAALDAKKLGIRVDAEPTANAVVLLGADGTITPLLSDEASRALFLDKRLRDRPAELRGKRFGGVPYLQVVTFKVEQEGKLQTPEYYCNICTISVRFPQVCPCCQGPMELRMKPGR